MGEVSAALLRAAATGPGTVRELAARAQVGFGVARYTATRLAHSGALAALNPGMRPAVLAVPDEPAQVAAASAPAGDAFLLLGSCFWRHAD
jgi:hypothetical protein